MNVTGNNDHATEDEATERAIKAFIGWPEELAASRNSAERKEIYTRYLASPAWASKRQGALERAGNRCQICNGKNRLQVHHRTYERVGDEDATDLTVLCRRCHSIFHDKRGVSQPQRPKKNKRNGKQTGPRQPCPVCLTNWTTKQICKPCHRARRQAPKPPPKPLPPDPRSPDEKTFAALASQLSEGGRKRAKMTRSERMRGQWQSDA